MKLTVFLAALAALGAMALADPGEVSAAPCEYRTGSHVAEHGGLKADSAWHVAHGDLPTCGAENTSHRASESEESYDSDDDGKSRYCRKRWYC